MRRAARSGALHRTHTPLGGPPSLDFVRPAVADAAPLVTEIA